DRALAAANPAYKITDRDRISRDSAMVDSVMVRINTANLDEQIFARIARVAYNQNILKDITLSGRNENNQMLHMAAQLKHGTREDEVRQTLGDDAVDLMQPSSTAGDYVFGFGPTAVKFNDVEWDVHTSETLDHSITYSKKTGDFLMQNVRLYSDASG